MIQMSNNQGDFSFDSQNCIFGFLIPYDLSVQAEMVFDGNKSATGFFIRFKKIIQNYGKSEII